MSKLAQSLSGVDPKPAESIRRGPAGLCLGKYPAEDLDDWREVQRLRAAPSNWREAQRIVDQNLGITDPIPNDKFRYHWRRKCGCWPDALRLS